MGTQKPANYNEAEAWLLSMMDYERMLGSGAVRYDTHAFDLVHFREQLKRLDDPHLRYPVIHVAGTKGKGSTCAFLEAALRRCGYRTGLYTSPHLFRFTERIKVDGHDIADGEFCRLVDELGRLVTENDGQESQAIPRSFRTVFEILTAAAFVYFAEQRVDVAIVETGLGGRLDSTNMFEEIGDYPLVNVITAIGLDHTAILGETLEAITREKAGIIRGHARVVVAPQASDANLSVVRGIIEKSCRDVGATGPVFVSDNCIVSRDDLPGNCFKLRAAMDLGAESELSKALTNEIHVCPSLQGAHQAANAATAVAALIELEAALAGSGSSRPTGGDWPELNPDKVVEGIEHTRWPGRFQIVESCVPVIVDGAHCAISAAALAEECGRRFGKRPVVIVAGFLRDKAGGDLLGAVFQRLPVLRAVAVAPPSPRAVSTGHIEEALSKYLDSGRVESAADIDEAVATALDIAEERGAYVVLFGSLYLVGPALRALGVKSPDLP